MKVLICDPVDEAIPEHFADNEDVELEETFDRDSLLDALPGAHVLLVRSGTTVDEEVLTRGDRLRLVVRAGVGLDNVDLEAADEHDVTVHNTPEASTNAVAELVVGLILSVYREIPRADAAMKNGDWIKSSVQGREIQGKTAGIIGFGRIGRRVGEILTGFGASLVAFDEYIPDNRIRAGGAEPRNLITLLEESDLITLHIPLTEETHHLIGREELKTLRSGAVLINCARGGVIDESALNEAIESGEVLGAGLDTFEQEPPDQSDLVLQPRVVATPHVGASTSEGQRRIAELVIERIEEQLQAGT